MNQIVNFDFEESVTTKKLGIIAITESRLNTKDKNYLSEYDFHGCFTLSCNRGYRVGSGVILYINNNLYPCAKQTEKLNNIDLILFT